MRFRNTPTSYGLAAQVLHWAVVALILTQFVLAYVAKGLPLGMQKLALLAQHKSVGITVLLLAVVRLLWRAFGQAPRPIAPSAWQRSAASVMHWALYVLLFAVPVTGWMMSSARNFPVSWFGLVTLPDLVGADRPLYDLLHGAHKALVYVLAALALLHLLAALKHHFLDRDEVLTRMIPKLRQ